MPRRRRVLLCPSCSAGIPASRHIFSKGFQCPECGIRLYVSPTYGRTLILIGYALGLTLTWVIGVRGVMRFCVAWTLTSLIILTFIVRVAPHLVRPRLSTLPPDHITRLGLGRGEGHYESSASTRYKSRPRKRAG